MRHVIVPTSLAAALLVLTGCVSGVGPVPLATTAPRTSLPPTGTGVDGAVLRFSSSRTSVDVTVGEDNPTVRDLLKRLPLRLTAEEFAGREKIVDLPDGLATAGSPGSDPEDGDLIYFVPWGNLGLYYDAAGIGYSADTIHIGTYDADREQLAELEGPITIERVDG